MKDLEEILSKWDEYFVNTPKEQLLSDAKEITKIGTNGITLESQGPK